MSDTRDSPSNQVHQDDTGNNVQSNDPDGQGVGTDGATNEVEPVQEPLMDDTVMLDDDIDDAQVASDISALLKSLAESGNDLETTMASSGLMGIPEDPHQSSELPIQAVQADEVSPVQGQGRETEVIVDPAYVQSQLYAPSTASSAPAVVTAPPAAAEEPIIDPSLFVDGGEEGFDPATLANLAALSRIAHEEDDEAAVTVQPDTGVVPSDEPGAQAEERQRRASRVQEPELSRDQVRALVEGLRGPKKDGKKDDGLTQEKIPEEDEEEPDEKEERLVEIGENEARRAGENDQDQDQEDEEDDEPGKTEGRDGEYKDDKFHYVKGKKKRKRNRTVLSCTECHRRNINIPCSRCVSRGVAGLCRMEYPAIPPRKKRKPTVALPINHELGLRVQALEALIRSGSNMDSDSANAAAMETIMQATRAAKAGNTDAGNALASLTNAAGAGVDGMEAAEQSGLLMEVLQQLSSASMARQDREEEIPEETDDPWSTVPEAAAESLLPKIPPPDPTDSNAQPIINLALPGFREDDGRIFIPPTVRYVEKAMRTQNILSKEALSIQGDERFLLAGTRFAYGADAPAVRKGLVASIQSISLTGALRIASSFLSRFPALPAPGPRTIFVPDPLSWEDETALKSAGSGVELRQMRFLDPRGTGVDWEGMREDLMNATAGSAVLLYVGGSIPSGTELNASQWRLLTLILLERRLIPLCILPSQGLASGDPAKDAQPVRFMVHEGLPVLLVQSFDATMGIYADSPSIVSLVTQSAEVKARVESQFRTIARGIYLHPSPWGAHVVQAILNDAKLYPAWLNEIKAMSDRLRSVRDKLHDLLVNKLKTPGNWFFIKRAAGMYCSTLLAPDQIRSLAQNKRIQLLPDGSLSLGCLNATRIDQLARALDAVTRASIREAEEAQQQAVAMELALTAAREAAAKQEAEAAVRAAKEAETRAREEDAAMMERSIADAILAQQRAEEEEREREKERREMDEAIEKAKERAEIQRRADEILASIGM